KKKNIDNHTCKNSSYSVSRALCLLMPHIIRAVKKLFPADVVITGHSTANESSDNLMVTLSFFNTASAKGHCSDAEISLLFSSILSEVSASVRSINSGVLG